MALPVGNPTDGSLYLKGICTGETRSDPCVVVFNYGDILRLKGGFYADFVFNRHMAIYRARHDGADIDTVSLRSNAAYVAMNFFDWADFFGIVGATHITLTTDGSSFSRHSSLISLDFKTQMCWGVGTKVTLWKMGDFSVGVEGQYFRTMPHLNSMVRLATGDINYFNFKNIFTYDEWQVGLGASYRYHWECTSMVPYIAIKRARGEMVFDDFAFAFNSVDYTLESLKSKKLWGYAVGMSMILSQMIGVTVEGRFADEKALYINGQLRF